MDTNQYMSQASLNYYFICMSSILQNDDLLYIEYNEKEDMTINKFKNCDTSDTFMKAISQYKTVFEKIYPAKTL